MLSDYIVFWMRHNRQTLLTAVEYIDIDAGTVRNEYAKWEYGLFSGDFNQITSGEFAESSTEFGDGLNLKKE